MWVTYLFDWLIHPTCPCITGDVTQWGLIKDLDQEPLIPKVGIILCLDCTTLKGHLSKGTSLLAPSVGIAWILGRAGRKLRVRFVLFSAREIQFKTVYIELVLLCHSKKVYYAALHQPSLACVSPQLELIWMTTHPVTYRGTDGYSKGWRVSSSGNRWALNLLKVTCFGKR